MKLEGMGKLGKLAQDAKQGLEKAEKLSGEAGEAAKNLLQGAKKVESLAGLSGKLPGPVLELLKKLIGEAEELAGSASGKNEQLAAAIRQAKQFLESGDGSSETAAKITAELGALIKAASGDAGGAAPASGVAAGAGRRASSGAEGHSAPPQTAPKAPSAQFSDVESGAYYYEAVQWAVQKGVASGTSETTFSPDQTCTRAQTISFLWRAAGSPAPQGKANPFTDVAEGAYYYDAVLWAAERGIVSGSAFHPDEAVTRGQLSTFLYRQAGSPAVKGDVSFTDVPKDAYFCQAVAWVAGQGITSGTGEHTFSPDAACTRGQIVTFLYRARK